MGIGKVIAVVAGVIVGGVGAYTLTSGNCLLGSCETKAAATTVSHESTGECALCPSTGAAAQQVAMTGTCTGEKAEFVCCQGKSPEDCCGGSCGSDCADKNATACADKAATCAEKATACTEKASTCAEKATACTGEAKTCTKTEQVAKND